MRRMPIKGLGKNSLAERVPMFNLATKPIINQAAVWLASVLLLWPGPPQQSCGCDRGFHEGCCKSHQTHQRGNGHRSCCQELGGHEAAGKPRASCCCKSTASNSRPATSRCRQATTLTQSCQKCCCGSNCKCHVSDQGSQPSGTPATSNDETSRRIELRQPLRTVAIVVNVDLSACSDIRMPNRAVSSTAIDRCRVLSRFTI